jgi:hypothetical protein
LSRGDRPGLMRRVWADKWGRRLLLFLGWLAGTILLFAAWIGTAILRGSTDRDAGAVALNLVLIIFLATIFLLVMHRAMYRWFLHINRKRATGALRSGEREPEFGSEPTAPPPRIDWPWTLRLRHAFMYAVGLATLLYVFASYADQLAIARFIVRHSAGSSSAGSLSSLLFVYLPMVWLSGLAMLLTFRQMRRRDAGLLGAREKLLLDAETSWLFSFAAAFTTTSMLCNWTGSMIVQHL